jgi:hypothetical protein
MSYFQLILRITPSIKEFRDKIGLDNYNKLKEEGLKNSNFSCQGCKISPPSQDSARKTLFLNVIEENQEDCMQSKCVTLCKACTATQHVDSAIKNEWVTLVNSTFSQVQLIEMQRINQLQNNIRPENFRILKINPLEFLKKLENQEVNRINKTKIIFTSKFEWDDYV